MQPTLMGPLAKVAPFLDSNAPDPIKEQAKEFKKFKNSKEGKEFVGWVKNKYTAAKQARTREVSQWNLNLAMYFGNQNVRVTRDGVNAGKLATISKRPNVEQLIINRVRPLIRTELARMLSQKPAASAVPASSEDEDLMAAMAAEQVWESLYSRKKFHTHFSRAAWWTATVGTGFIKTYWDDTVVDKMQPEGAGQGDIEFASVQPFNLFVPDLLEQEVDGQPYIIEVSVKPVDWLNYIFKDKLERPVTAEARAATSILEDAYATGRQDDSSKDDSAYVYELWLKPGACKFAIEGAYAMIVGNELVAFLPGKLPYAHGEYPYSKIENIPTAKFYGASVIEDVISLQREYNKIRSQIADNRRKAGSIQFTAYKGSILPEKVTNEAGQFILVRPGMQMPQATQPANLPSYISENMDRVLSDIEDISGQHQVSKGNVPTGVTAATAISYLQERDDSLLTHTYQSIEQATERVAKQSISLTVQYWDQPRLVQVIGADGAFDSQLFAGSDIERGTDIRVEAGSALPQSKAAKQALLMDLMKMGFISSDDGLKMMEIGGAQKIFEQLRQDERQAQRENIRLKNLNADIINQFAMAWQSQQEQYMPEATDASTQMPLSRPPVIPVNSYDNHAVHIDVHNRFRKGQAYELLPDEVKAEFEAHVQHHKMMAMIDQSGGLMPQDATMGTGGEGEFPPAPDGGASTTEMMAQESGDLSGVA